MLIERSYAKINLYLRVISKRDDGYHNISSLMTKVSLYDTIAVEGADRFEIISDAVGLSTGPDNIITRVYEIVRQRYQVGFVKFFLIKRIPWGAGLGGGSSNAATALKLIDRLFSLNLKEEEKRGVLEMVGSDTVFFLTEGYSSYVAGRGEEIVDGPKLPKMNILLVKPMFSVATKEAYEGVKLRLTNDGENCSNKGFLSYPDIINGLENDFEKTVFVKYPELRWIKETLLEKGADGALMSGSGSTVFGLFSSRGCLEQTAEFFKKRQGYFVCMVNNL
ncbi:MAG: 4-(cytidine 5'-diphospho)-2-C-methyl-D-erythritol kinase [Calditerrivibrio sp.]|nr:4-(cytidine 5'-diphospho)-2-C-methyl-D-erythritol kinase [Calditerrivibrio sp.]